MNREWNIAAGPETTFTAPADGVFEIEYAGRDAADNVSAQQKITLRRDTVAPTVAIVAKDAAGTRVANGAVLTRGDRLTFAYDCFDATSGMDDCGGDVAAGDAADTATLGYHSVLATAVDAAGNETTSIFEYTVEDPATPTGPENPPGPTNPAGTPGPAAPVMSAGSAVSPIRTPLVSARQLAATGAGPATPLFAGAAGFLAVGGVALIVIGLRCRIR